MASHPLLILCLALTWLVWGSTYLGIKLALESFPPFFLAGSRYVLAGLLMAAYLYWRKAPLPSWRQFCNASLIGFLMLTVGNGMVCVAERSMASGAAALFVAATPLLTVLVNWLLGMRAKRMEFYGLGLGVLGMGLLNLDASLAADLLAQGLMVGACLAWAIASALMPRLDLPAGPTSAAIQMMMGGVLSLPVAFLSGENWPVEITATALWANLYLALFGSVIAYSAYVWLLRNVRPALATSCCYVNPVVALGLGFGFMGEEVSGAMLAGVAVILSGVAMLAWASRAQHE